MNPEQLLELALEGPGEGYDLCGAPMVGCGLRLQGLLGGVRVVVDDDTPTLSIGHDRRGHVLRVGPAFCRLHVRTRADARLVIAHELLHAVRGHLRVAPERHRGLRGLQNLSLDILVNAAALQWALNDEHPEVLARLYAPRSFPGCLLLPPTDLLAALPGRWPASLLGQGTARMAVREQPELARRAQDTVAQHLARLGVRHADAFARAYVRGWFDFPDPAGYWELMRGLFTAELGINPEPPGLLLVGEHGDGSGVETLSEEVLQQLRESEAWFGRVSVEAPTRDQIDRFCREVAGALDQSADGRTTSTSFASAPTPLPRPGRRDLPLLALGVLPAMWHPRLPVRTPRRGGLRVYVDVSGSMRQLAPVLFGLIRALGSQLELPAWAWSVGRPEPMDGDDLAAGRYRTRGGTDFAPVVAHAAERRFQRILVLTDGLFQAGPRLAAHIEDANLHVTFALAGPRGAHCRGPLERLGGHVFVLDQHMRAQRRAGRRRSSGPRGLPLHGSADGRQETVLYQR